MPFRRALLSAITLFGGHFLNRRLDRIALIGALLVVAVTFWVRAVFALQMIEGELFYSTALWVSRLPLILVVPIALLSAYLTFGDARPLESGALTTTIRVIRLSLTLLARSSWQLHSSSCE